MGVQNWQALVLLQQAYEEWDLKEKNEKNVNFKIIYSRNKKRILLERAKVLRNIAEFGKNG